MFLSGVHFQVSETTPLDDIRLQLESQLVTRAHAGWAQDMCTHGVSTRRVWRQLHTEI